MPFSGHESRCCSFCNKRAKTMQHVDEEWSRMLTAAARPTAPVAAACTAWDAAAAGDARASESAR